MNYTQKCSCCQLEKKQSCFAFKNKKTGKLSKKCKECSSKYNVEHYKKNKGQYIQKARKNNLRYIERNKSFINEYKHKNGCYICGEKNPLCLDFHHENPKDKKSNISRIKNNSHSIKYLMKEISKCKVICSNCHRKLHYDS